MKRLLGGGGIVLLVLLAACSDQARNMATRPDVTPALTHAQSACDHPYLPMRPGTYWRYQSSATTAGDSAGQPPTTTWAIYNVRGQEGRQTAVLGAGDTLATWLSMVECDPAAGLSPVGYDYTGPSFYRMFYLYLPPVDRLAAGASWSGLAIRDLDLGGGMIALRQTITETYTVVGAEPVTVQGQVHDGLQIAKAATTHVWGCGYVPYCRDEQGGLRQDTNYTITQTTTFTLAQGIGAVEITEQTHNSDALPGHPDVSSVTYRLVDFGWLDVARFRDAWHTYARDASGWAFEYPALYDEEPYRSVCGPRSANDLLRIGAVTLTVSPLPAPRSDGIGVGQALPSGQAAYYFSMEPAWYQAPACEVDEIGLSIGSVYAHAVASFRELP